MRKQALALVKVTVGPLLLLVLLRIVGIDSLWQSVRGARTEFLLLALLAYFGTMLLRSYRWQLLLRAHGFALPLPQLLYLDFVGSFFNALLPSSVGGDVMKFYELNKHHPAVREHNAARIASSLLADRICGLAVLLLMGTAIIPFAGDQIDNSTALLLLAVTTSIFLALLVLLHSGVRQQLEGVSCLGWLLRRRGIRGLYASLSAYRLPVLLHAAFASFLFNTLMILVNVALGLAFGLLLPLSVYLITVPLISLLLALPISINGLGVREGGYLFFLGQAGVAPPLALSVGLAYYGCTVVAGVVGGILYLLGNARWLPLGKLEGHATLPTSGE